MKEIQEKLFSLLDSVEEVDSSRLDIPSNTLHGLLLSLQSTQQISFIQKESTTHILTQEATDILKNGSREYNFYKSIKDGDDISVCQSDKIGSSFAFKYKFIFKRENKIYKNENVTDFIKESLEKKYNLGELIKRNLVKEKREVFYLIRKGSNFKKENKFIDKIDLNYLTNKISDLQLKEYNFNSRGLSVEYGSLHPLLKFKSEIKKIFLEMGFEEMDTSKFIESAFWNFDSLYQPQDHPSRDLHDTFYLSDVIFVSDLEISEEEKEKILECIQRKEKYKNCEIKVFDKFDRELMREEKGIIKVIFRNKDVVNEEYLQRVKNVHENGLENSIGYRYNWSEKESEKLVLRTHTTANSAKHLFTMPEGSRFFSIDRVFRNESVDSTHLPEFHQVEGLLIGDELTLSDLIQTITLFFNKLGIKELKFKPAYNPYTEPSAEVYGFHPLLNRWIEIGNSGIFRPEMIQTMGYKNKTVLGFGLSVERPAMIKYKCNNIRELMGSRVDLDFVKEEGICQVNE